MRPGSTARGHRSAAIGLAWLASGLIPYLSSDPGTLLGDRVITALERPVGMVPAIVAVRTLMQGIARVGGLAGA